MPVAHQIGAAILTGPHQITRRLLATLGTVTSTICPKCSNRAGCAASRASVRPGPQLGTAVSTAPRPDNQSRRRATPGPIRTQSAPPHRSPPLVRATRQSIPRSPGDPDTTAAGKPRRYLRPIHTPRPIVRAHPSRCSYAEPSLGLHPHLWLYRPGPNSCRQPRFTCERGPSAWPFKPSNVPSSS
jgi:hypothetical protein